MTVVTLSDFRRNVGVILHRVAQGERFVLCHRGKPAARLEPLDAPSPTDSAGDPFLSIANRARPSPKGKTHHAEVDWVLYGPGAGLP